MKHLTYLLFFSTLCITAPLATANPTLTPGTWVNITPAGIDKFGQGITLDPSNPSTIYWCNVGSPGGVYKSTDAGSTWAKKGQLDVPIHVRVDPKNSNHLYCVDGVRGSTYGFWVSTDGGDTWTMPQGFINVTADPTIGIRDMYSVAADPSDFSHLLVTFHNAWPDGAGYTYASGILESKDAGNSWTIHYPVAGMTEPGFAAFFLYSPDLKVGNANTWLLGCQGGGYWRTADAGQNWTKVIATNMMHGGNQIYYTKSGVLYSGAANWPAGPMKSTDNGLTWKGSTSGLAAWDNTMGIIGDGTNLYTGTFNGAGPFFTSLETDGLNWTTFGSGAQSFGSGPFEMDIDPVRRIVYAATPADGVLALKLNGTGSTASLPQSRMSAQNKTAKTRLLVSVGNKEKSLAAIGAPNQAGSGATYDVNGHRMNGRSNSNQVLINVGR